MGAREWKGNDWIVHIIPVEKGRRCRGPSKERINNSSFILWFKGENLEESFIHPQRKSQGSTVPKSKSTCSWMNSLSIQTAGNTDLSGQDRAFCLHSSVKSDGFCIFIFTEILLDLNSCMFYLEENPIGLNGTYFWVNTHSLPLPVHLGFQSLCLWVSKSFKCILGIVASHKWSKTP